MEKMHVFFNEKKSEEFNFFSTKKLTHPFVDIWERKKYDGLTEFKQITCMDSQLQ